MVTMVSWLLWYQNITTHNTQHKYCSRALALSKKKMYIDFTDWHSCHDNIDMVVSTQSFRTMNKDHMRHSETYIYKAKIYTQIDQSVFVNP